MSYVNHKAVCITSFDMGVIAELRNEISNQTTCSVSGIYISKVNAYGTFFVIPCGSKAGWGEELTHIKNLLKVIDLISEFNSEEGGTFIDYSVCSYGETNG